MDICDSAENVKSNMSTISTIYSFVDYIKTKCEKKMQTRPVRLADPFELF